MLVYEQWQVNERKRGRESQGPQFLIFHILFTSSQIKKIRLCCLGFFSKLTIFGICFAIVPKQVMVKLVFLSLTLIGQLESEAGSLFGER